MTTPAGTKLGGTHTACASLCESQQLAKTRGDSRGPVSPFNPQ
jgi:hypothetical protein